MTKNEIAGIKGTVIGNGKDSTLKFIDELKERKHLVLFYEEPEFARYVEFYFIKKGLENGEHCIYMMRDEPDFIKNEMNDFGIDVSKYEKKGILHVYQMPETHDYSKKGLDAVSDIFKKITSNTVPPIRVVSSFVSELDKEEAMEFELSTEKEFHETFDNYQVSWLCPYFIKKFDPKNLEKNMINLMKLHHNVILTQSSEKLVCLDIQD